MRKIQGTATRLGNKFGRPVKRSKTSANPVYALCGFGPVTFGQSVMQDRGLPPAWWAWCWLDQGVGDLHARRDGGNVLESGGW